MPSFAKPLPFISTNLMRLSGLMYHNQKFGLELEPSPPAGYFALHFVMVADSTQTAVHRPVSLTLAKRHHKNLFAKFVHLKMYKIYDLRLQDKWYDHFSEGLIEYDAAKILRV